MKTNKLQFLLVLTGLLVTECSLNANPVRLSESGSLYPYAANALSLEKNTEEEACFFDTNCDADTQKEVLPTTYTKILEDKLKVKDKKITELKKLISTTNENVEKIKDDVEKIKKEHAQLKQMNVEKIKK